VRSPMLEELPPPPVNRTGWPWTEAASVTPTSTSPSTSTPWPSISVVIPSYQQGEFLEETLRSVLLQGYPDLELLVMDGGSTDETVSVIRKYEGFIAGWVSERDDGQSAAINKGWRRSRGELLTWLNSDDVLLPGWAPTMAGLLAAEPELDLAYCNVQMVDRESRPLWIFEGRVPSLERLLVMWQAPFAQQGFLMRRHVLEAIGFLDESLHFTMDAEYWLRLMMAHSKLRHLPRTLAGSRLHAAAKTATRYDIFVTDFLRVTETFCRTATPDLKLLAERVRRRRYWSAAHVAYDNSDTATARRYALRHLRDDGFRAVPRVAGMVGLSLLGKPGRRVLGLWRRLRAGR
jgi:glycosyltransferase involved in cell wall biosynthesis